VGDCSTALERVDTFKEIKGVSGMHQADRIVVVALVLASIATVKLAPAIVPMLLTALVRYRRATSSTPK
jgi:hypothetical protein